MAWVWTTLKNLIVGKIYYIGFAVKRDNPLDKVCGESVNANVDKPRFYHYTNWNNSNEVFSLTHKSPKRRTDRGLCKFFKSKTPISSQKMLERFMKNLMLSSIYSDYVVIQCKNRFDTFIDTPYTQYTLVVTENTMRHAWKWPNFYQKCANFDEKNSKFRSQMDEFREKT